MKTINTKSLLKNTALILLITALMLSVGIFSAGCAKLKEKIPLKIQEKPQIDVNKQLDFGKLETFNDVFDAVLMIDKKYQVDFKKEALFGALADINYIPYIKQDLAKLRKQLDPAESITTESIIKEFTRNRTQKQLGILFVDARTEMIKSEEQFHKGYSKGTQGLVGDGFYCREEEMLLETINSFNTSVQQAKKVMYYFDELLTDSQEITWSLIGVEDAKPLFYYSPVADIKEQLTANRAAISQYCSEERLKGKPKEKAFISIDQDKYPDLFIQPQRVIVKKIWRIIQEPIAGKIEAKAEANTEAKAAETAEQI